MIPNLASGSHVIILSRYSDIRALIENQSYLEVYSIQYLVGPLGVVAPSS